MDEKQLQEKCRSLRCDVVEMIAAAGSGHAGGSLSVMELLAALYYGVMRVDPKNPADPNRDRFVLSKGHAAPALYAMLADKGYFTRDLLKNFRQLGSPLQGHPDKKKLPGLDASTGSLGQGVSIAVGMALGAKLQNKGVRVYTILGDGELQEGLVWEAAMAAAHYRLDNLCVIIDNNGLQIDGTTDEVMGLGDIGEKYRAFGFAVEEVTDGNDIASVLTTLNRVGPPGKPRCILAHTVKGRGVSFMENQVSWHAKVISQEELEQALKELKGVAK
jgi:transketolase